MKEYYLYRHIRLDKNEPFYIGIGTKQKGQTSTKIYKRAYAKDNRNKYWLNIVNKTGFEVEILLDSTDKSFIKDREIEFISLYGRKDLGKGILCNMTDGGEGITGIIHSDETKAKLSLRRKGKKLSEEHRAKIKASFSKERRLELSESFKRNITNSKEVQERIATVKESESYKLKMSNSIKQAYMNNPHLRELVSERFSKKD